MKKFLLCAYLISILLAGTANAGEEHIKLKGDLRYRDELIAVQDKDNRHRHRIRLRVGIDARLAQTLDLFVRIASGSDDPLSTNQTITDGFSTKNIGLDLAYFDWHPESVQGVNFLGGKMKNPFYKVGKTELIWDGDLNPEGLAFRLTKESGKVETFASLGCFPVMERKKDDDALLLGFQGSLKFKLPGNKTHLLLGLGYFDFTNAQGNPPFFDPGDGAGNTLDQAGKYMEDFNEFEVFAEFGFKAGNAPVTLFADYVTNTAADNDNAGWLAGLSVGKCKDPGSCAFRYNYRKVEKDAVVGAFADSDFGGGGTGSKGHEAGFDCQIAKRVKAGTTYFFNERGDAGEDYQRLQVDLNLKF